VAEYPYAPFLRELLDGAPLLRRLVLLLEAAAFALFMAVMRALGPDRASRAGGALFRAWGPRMTKSRHVRTNLSIAFPEKPPAEIDAIERGAWATIGSLAAEYAHIDTICCREPERRVEIVVKGDLRGAQEEGRPAIFATAHLANFELATFAVSRVGAPVTALYTPHSNPLIDRMIQRRRSAINTRLVPRDGGVRELVRELARGRSVGFVADTRMDGGELVPFFGRDAATTTVPARLALRFDCELVPVRVERLEGARFRVTLYDPVRAEAPGLDAKQRALVMTRKLNAHFEDWIRERPEQWQCMKRRWPKDAARA